MSYSVPDEQHQEQENEKDVQADADVDQGIQMPSMAPLPEFHLNTAPDLTGPIRVVASTKVYFADHDVLIHMYSIYSMCVYSHGPCTSLFDVRFRCTSLFLALP